LDGSRRFEQQLLKQQSNRGAGGGGGGMMQQQSPAAPAAPFRPSSLQITLGVQQATAVLCNDKPETFGAPDVLQCSLSGVSLAYDTATLLPDRPANKAGKSCGAAYLQLALYRKGHALFDLA
jgi:hypothetical protein